MTTQESPIRSGRLLSAGTTEQSALDDTSWTTIAAAPSANQRKIVHTIAAYNPNTGANRDMEIAIYDGTTRTRFYRQTINGDESMTPWTYDIMLDDTSTVVQAKLDGSPSSAVEVIATSSLRT